MTTWTATLARFAAHLTFALIVLTAVYAFHTQRMVQDGADARADDPAKLALSVHKLRPTAVNISVRNVGPGAAVDVDVQLICEPVGNAKQDTRHW